MAVILSGGFIGNIIPKVLKSFEKRYSLDRAPEKVINFLF